jgi:hypothetical protein
MARLVVALWLLGLSCTQAAADDPGRHGQAKRPRGKAPSMTHRYSMNDADLKDAEQVARREGPAALGEPTARVADIKSATPFDFLVILDSGKNGSVLVVDGKVVVGKEPKALPRYLEQIEFLARKNLTYDQLLGLILDHAVVPHRYRALPLFGVGSGEGEGGDRPALTFDADGGATLTAYSALLSQPPRQAFPSLPDGIGAAPATLLRTTIRVTPRYELVWTVEKKQPGETKWRPAP